MHPGEIHKILISNYGIGVDIGVGFFEASGSRLEERVKSVNFFSPYYA